ncbi:hypothetical protein [Salinisphaera sp. T31B1]|uniref:hypothetical protein n=1 Tax=Salinisphaera sp. T31B1 TaxID=727963 RepID=UPI0033402D0E
MLTRKRIVLPKIETTYGEDASPDGASRVITTSDFSWTPYQGDTQTRDRLTDTFGARAEVNVGPNTSLQFSVPLAGSGEAGTPPVFGPLLRACGMSETIADGESVTYQPVTDATESVTLYYNMDGVLQAMVGTRGTFVLNANGGAFPTLQFTLTSFYKRPVTQAAPTLSDIEQADEIPVNKQNTVGSVHGHAACMSGMTVTQGNSVNYFNRINCESIEITDRETTGSVTIDAVRPDVQDYFAAMESHEGVILAPVSMTHGKTAGNIVEVSGSKVQLSGLSMGDDNGRAQYEMTTRYIRDQGDDEFTLVFK